LSVALKVKITLKELRKQASIEVASIFLAFEATIANSQFALLWRTFGPPSGLGCHKRL